VYIIFGANTVLYLHDIQKTVEKFSIA